MIKLAGTTYPTFGMYTVPRGVKRDGTPQDATELLLLTRPSAQQFRLVCMCPESSRREDGISCRHVALFLARMRPWHRSRTTVEHPKTRESKRSQEVAL